MENLKQQVRELYVHVPYKLKNQIDAAFAATYTQNNINKIYFLVYKINLEGNLACNIRKLAGMLSLETRQVSQILSTLKTLLIINNDGLFFQGIKSTEYFMLPPAKYPNKTYNKDLDYQMFYYLDNKSTPKWVQRYIEDYGNIKWKTESNSSANKPQPKKVKTVLNIEIELKDLKKELQKLRDENQALRLQLEIKAGETISAVETIEPVKIDFIESLQLNKQYSIKNKDNIELKQSLLDYLKTNINTKTKFYRYENYQAYVSKDVISIAYN
ncbi:hypothetical protein [Pedobacter aquatilis]|uniref:hypothetical protein n=1 Tax=Pedobacter aquatilis TaxID=351343 RepID=UPI00292F583A|nr:hypothetical protein [Pedobacter aquatilis]